MKVSWVLGSAQYATEHNEQHRFGKGQLALRAKETVAAGEALKVDKYRSQSAERAKTL
jgi:hypothetical protein